MAHYSDHPTPTTAYSYSSSSFGQLTLSAVLDDLAARFIVNLPQDELESMDRVCFQIEQAHWYYEDFIRPNASNPSALPSYNLKAFSLLMFKSCPLLHDLVPQHARIWTSFMQYKERVPVCGAVLINEWWDKVLLVKGWNKGSAWSFPRGKINKQEPEAMCAVREVLEETGFDLTPYFPRAQLDPSYVEPEGQERTPYYVELVIREQKIRLYFVPGIRESTRFETRTRKEISKIDWFRLSDLPTWDRDSNHHHHHSHGQQQQQRKGKGAGAARSKGELANGKQAKFYMVTPFISHLKLWIDRNKPRNIPARTSNPNSPLPLPAYVAPEHQKKQRQNRNQLREFALPGGRQLQPWSATDDDDDDDDDGGHPTNHLPSDSEVTESTEADEEEEEDGFGGGTGGEQKAAPQQGWTTTQQGTDALQALFFGAGAEAGADDQGDTTLVQSTFAAPPLHAFTVGHPATAVVGNEPIRPLPVPHQSTSSAAARSQSQSQSQLSTPNSHRSQSQSTIHATPPQVAYERQQSFVQPKPKQSENHQTRLLELLTGSAATPPPPTGTATRLVGAMGGLTLESPSPLAQQLPLPSSNEYHGSYQYQHEYGHHSATDPASSSYDYLADQRDSVSHNHHHPDLFSPDPMHGTSISDSHPAAAAAAAAPVFVSDLEESQKQEKRDALLRALLSVAAKSPPKPPPRELESHGDPAVTVPSLPNGRQEHEARWYAQQPASSSGSAPNGGGGGSLLSILNGSGNNHGAPPPHPRAAMPSFGVEAPSGQYTLGNFQPFSPVPVHQQHPHASIPTPAYPLRPQQQHYGPMFGMDGRPPMQGLPFPQQQQPQQQTYPSSAAYGQPSFPSVPPASAPAAGPPSHSMPPPPPAPPLVHQQHSLPPQHAVSQMPPSIPTMSVQQQQQQQYRTGPPPAQHQGQGNAGQLLGLLNGRG